MCRDMLDWLTPSLSINSQRQCSSPPSSSRNAARRAGWDKADRMRERVKIYRMYEIAYVIYSICITLHMSIANAGRGRSIALFMYKTRANSTVSTIKADAVHDARAGHKRSVRHGCAFQRATEFPQRGERAFPTNTPDRHEERKSIAIWTGAHRVKIGSRHTTVTHPIYRCPRFRFSGG